MPDSDTVVEYEIAWSVYGTRTVRATSQEDAQNAVNDWLEDEHGMTANVADGWDFTVTGEKVTGV